MPDEKTPDLFDTTDWSTDKPAPERRSLEDEVTSFVAEMATITDAAAAALPVVGAPQLGAVPPLLAGVHYDVSHERYHADPCPEPALSSTIARLMIDGSSLKAWRKHPRLGGAVVESDEEGEEPSEEQRKESHARDRGQVLDSLVLGGDVKIAVIPADSWRTKWAKEQKAEARANGEIPVLEHVYARYRKTAEKIKENLTALLAENGYEGGLCGRSQVTIIWQNEYGSWCKMRTDHVVVYEEAERYLILDLKTSYDASPEGAARSMNTYGAGLQRAVYVDGFEHHHPHLVGKGEMLFGYVEPSDPWDCTINRCDGEMRELGERQWRRAQRRWAECMEKGSWPGYPKQILNVAARPYLLMQDQEREFSEQGATEPPPFMVTT